MQDYKRQLTRVRLVNWHYFENETININGSTLISGENTAGKSTILDAIQLVLTTNTRKFNAAANEKGNRNLKGYVRCKVGNEGETYLRKNVVISNVALEFYDEKTDRYFILGVHITSTDEESALNTRWYLEEVRLEAISFINHNIPCKHSEFLVNGKKVKFIETKNLAMERFKRRLGNLDDRFFDMIPKSLAFKPMDNVKDFINKFILPDEKIEVETLKTNIETLSELESELEKSNKQLFILTEIVEKYKEIKDKEQDILTNEFLINIASIDDKKTEIEKCLHKIEANLKYIDGIKYQEKELETESEELETKIRALYVALESNGAKLIDVLERRIQDTNAKIINSNEQITKLKENLDDIRILLRLLQEVGITIIEKSKFEQLEKEIEPKEKSGYFQEMSNALKMELENINRKYTELDLKMVDLEKYISDLQIKINELENKKLQFPRNTILLKEAIEKGFVARNINTKVYIVAELLEITDSRWQNAVEGYFNTQKFNIIVEPKYYDIALSIYHKNRKNIHSAGLINTKKIEKKDSVDNKSLAYVVKSENRYAKAYSDYILGRVIRCDDMTELEEHKIAITADCMLYQGYVSRYLDPETYKNPYVGQHAYRVQLVNTRKELESATKNRTLLRDEIAGCRDIITYGKKFNPEYMVTYIDAPYHLKKYLEQKREAELELRAASNNPNYIQLKMQITVAQEQKKKYQDEQKLIRIEMGKLESNNERLIEISNETKIDLVRLEEEHYAKSDKHNDCLLLAKEKYKINRKTKSPRTIAENFAKQRAQYANEREQLVNSNKGLIAMQVKFNSENEMDFLQGVEGIREYINAKKKLEVYDLVRYDEKIRKAKEDLEQIFKQDFLAKMRDNIEKAKIEFMNLNKALKNIYYGDDSYKFTIGFDKRKESLYRMITAESNQGGYSLWTQSFEAEYMEEMQELFAKLTTKDDRGDQIIKEYTDYRSYLDYDIEIHKKNGTIQKFSSIYGEKSGSETQVPYYVAIGASFSQLYRYGNSIRLMLLDEAFDKMDDERITSMIEFFHSINLQVLMATPPAKIEVIGEKVDTILTAIRVGNRSIVEEYDL